MQKTTTAFHYELSCVQHEPWLAIESSYFNFHHAYVARAKLEVLFSNTKIFIFQILHHFFIYHFLSNRWKSFLYVAFIRENVYVVQTTKHLRRTIYRCSARGCKIQANFHNGTLKIIQYFLWTTSGHLKHKIIVVCDIMSAITC